MMPMAVTGLSVSLCLIWAGQSALALSRGDPAGATPEGRGELPRLALIAAIIVLYILAIQYVGFFMSTVAMIPLLSGSLGYRRWTITLLTTAAFACVLYAVFPSAPVDPAPIGAPPRHAGGLTHRHPHQHPCRGAARSSRST